MSRPRPRVEGRGSPAVTAKGAESKAPKEARVVPPEMVKGSKEARAKLEAAYRAKAAHGMLKNKSRWAADHSNPHGFGCGGPDTSYEIDGSDGAYDGASNQ